MRDLPCITCDAIPTYRSTFSSYLQHHTLSQVSMFHLYRLTVSVVTLSLVIAPLTCVAVPRITPTSTPLIPPHPTQELVVFVGYPSLGKSSFYRKYFEPAGYVHINQDTLRTREKCVKAADEALQEGHSCVVGVLSTSEGVVLRTNG